MIHYHGTPINRDALAIKVLKGKHAFVSFVDYSQLSVVQGVCQSYAIDNGAYSFWRSNKEIDWNTFYTWIEKIKNAPGCDFVIIPDVIDGDETANDRLIDEWPFGVLGTPVWHLHESIDRLKNLCDKWPRVAFGSSGVYARVGAPEWWTRMYEVLNIICSDDGLPPTKLHGLRMMDPSIYTRIPFSSVDSTSVARNIAYDRNWTGTYIPTNKEMKAILIIDRIESYNGALCWKNVKIPQKGFFW